MRKILSLFSVLAFLTACQKPDDSVSMNTPSKPIERLEQEALEGSIEAYNQLEIAYLDYRPMDRNLYISLIMANKNRHYPAYVDVFNKLLDAYGGHRYEINEIGQIDAKTRRFMIECLEKASAGKVAEADSMLLQISKLEQGKYY